MTKHLSEKQYARERPVLYNDPIGGEAWVMGIDYPAVAARSRAGHFVMISVAGGIHPVLPRPFSIYRLIGEDGRALRSMPAGGDRADGLFWTGVRGFDILYKVVGDGTEQLTRKREGDRVGVMGPCGDGLYAPALPEHAVPEFVLLVGGGVGIVPLYFAAQQLRARGVPTDLFFGGRRREYLYDIDAFAPLGVTVHAATEDGSLGRRGLVTDALREHLEVVRGQGRDLTRGAIYACGPEPMLRVVQKVAAAYLVPGALSLERRMGCAMGACRGCVVRVASATGTDVRYERVCTEGPVFDAGRILL